MDLPPLQKDAGLLRMCHVLAELCHFAYVSRTADVGTSTSIAVPSMGLLSERAAVSAELVHFRCGSRHPAVHAYGWLCAPFHSQCRAC